MPHTKDKSRSRTVSLLHIAANIMLQAHEQLRSLKGLFWTRSWWIFPLEELLWGPQNRKGRVRGPKKVARLTFVRTTASISFICTCSVTVLYIVLRARERKTQTMPVCQRIANPGSSDSSVAAYVLRSLKTLTFWRLSLYFIINFLRKSAQTYRQPKKIKTKINRLDGN